MAAVFLLWHAPAARSAEPAAEVCPGAPSGSLVIVGGGGLPDVIRDRFLDLAGGKNARIVVIPTASGKADRPELLKSVSLWQAQNVASVQVLHTRNRAEADDVDFIKPLADATGVWLTGGDQSRLVSAYRGSAVERELRKLMARGGVIGGTSAGAAVMSSVMILGGNPVAEVGDGFGFLPGVVVDQHFHNRNRLSRLLGVLAKHPRCLGVGIDEQTAVVVKGRTLTVLGEAHVRLCLSPFGEEPADVKILKAGEEVDLIALSQSAIARVATAAPAKDKPAAGTAERSTLSSP